MLTAANLRKSKSQTASLLLFALIAAMLLNIGLVMSLKIGVFFDEQAEDNHAAHLSGVYEAGVASIEKGRTYLENHPDVTEIETTNAVGGWGNYQLNGLTMQGLLILSRAGSEQKIDPPTLIGDSIPLTGDAAYIPYTLMLNGGYSVGDAIKFNLAEAELSFTVAGATKEIMFGSQQDPFLRIYLSDENWDAINGHFPHNGLTLLSARLLPGKDASRFHAEYGLNVPNDGLFWALSSDIAKAGRTGIAMIAASMIVAFAVVLLFVSLIVIRFRIINSIEEGMTNIGVQKATGYRSVQIIASISLQFALIALAGGTLGIAVSQALIPLLMELWKPVLGLEWLPEFDAVTAAISVAAVLLTSLLVSTITSRRINRLHPLIALRGGMSGHSFDKNHLPLDKARGPLNFLLALKQVLQNKKRTAGVSLIVAAVTMASVVGLTLNYNMSERRGEFARSIFGEVPHIDVLFMLNRGNSGDAFKERMLNHPDVRKINGYTGNRPMSLDVSGTTTAIIVSEDTTLMESEMMIEGRYPKHDNEIALGTLVLKAAGKKIGDIVNVGNGENKSEYLITGVVQVTEGNGRNGIINGDGMRMLRPDFSFRDYAVYLNDGVDAKTFIESVKAAEGNVFEVVIEEQNQVNNLISSVSVMFTTITTGIWAATVFVIILVLYMIIKTAILRRRRELGIQKAVGFTTLQLMNQIALNMTPVILLGVSIGAVAGYFGVSPIVVAMFSGMGISKLSLAVPIGRTVIVSATLVGLAYIVSMLIAWRIRKISAYALVTE